MWVLLAFASAFFAGIMSILAKVGVKNMDANLATALRTIVVALFAWLMVFVVGSHATIMAVDIRSLLFLVLSGLATGGSWLCYFKALQLGDVSKVAPVDKSSTVLTMLLAMTFLGEGVTIIKVCAMASIGFGTYLMIQRKPISSKPDAGSVGSKADGRADSKADSKAETYDGGYKWLIFAGFSAVFASLTAIFGKVGIEGVEANLGTAIRTMVVLGVTWLIVLAQRKHKGIRQIDRRSGVFLALSGLATGLSWLCFYHALQAGPASVVVPIDKLSIVVTVAFGYFVLREKLKRLSVIGLVLIVAGTLALLI